MGIDLTKFCGRDECRLYLEKPFRHAGFTWATNGHILVRVPDEDARWPVLEAKINPEKVLAKLESSATWGEFEGDLPRRIDVNACDECGGSGRDKDNAQFECIFCDGLGFSDPEARISITVAGVPFALNYIRLMLTLPAVEIAPGSTSNDVRDSWPLLFRFDGGVGALMALRSNFDTHVEIVKRAA